MFTRLKALFLVCSFPLLSSMESPKNTEALLPLSNQNLIEISYQELCKTALQHCDVLFVGDTDHDNETLSDLFVSDESIKHYIEGGADDILRERYIGQESQVAPDHTKQLNIKPDSLVDIHFKGIDPQPPDKIDEIYMLRDSLRWDEFYEKLYERMQKDQELFENAKNYIAKNGKAVMIYGAAHGSAMNDGFLDDPSLSLIKISVYQSIDDYCDNFESRCNRRTRFTEISGIDNTHGLDNPHCIYIVDEQKVFIFKHAPSELKASIVHASFQNNTPVVSP